MKSKKSLHRHAGVLTVLLFCLLQINCALAHHVLGRPAYSLSEDSNTPPSMQVETQIGKYFVTYMAYPAFPKPGEQGRVNFYASGIQTGDPFVGEVSFTVRDDSWFSKDEEILGTQKIDDGVYRQGFVFQKEGDYIVTAKFESEGEPYNIDFPLRIGEPVSFGPLGLAVAVIVVAIGWVNISQRKRLMKDKAKQHHAEKVERA